jgi:hypothetical protein
MSGLPNKTNISNLFYDNLNSIILIIEGTSFCFVVPPLNDRGGGTKRSISITCLYRLRRGNLVPLPQTFLAGFRLLQQIASARHHCGRHDEAIVA